MARFRRRPIEVEAWRWQGQPKAEWPAWLERVVLLADGTLAVGGVRDSVRRGEWLVMEENHVMRLPHTVFEATYEAIDP